VHNNGNDALGKFDPRSDEAIFLGHSSHSKPYKMFNKRILCIEESVHVLFNETNSLVEIDAQDDDFELGLIKKDLLLPHEEGKDFENGSGLEAVSKKGGHGQNQTGRITDKPYSEQNKPSNSETGTRLVSETDSRIVLEPVSPINKAREESVLVDSSDHGSIKILTPLIKFFQILTLEGKQYDVTTKGWEDSSLKQKEKGAKGSAWAGARIPAQPC